MTEAAPSALRSCGLSFLIGPRVRASAVFGWIEGSFYCGPRVCVRNVRYWTAMNAGEEAFTKKNLCRAVKAGRVKAEGVSFASVPRAGADQGRILAPLPNVGVCCFSTPFCHGSGHALPVKPESREFLQRSARVRENRMGFAGSGRGLSSAPRPVALNFETGPRERACARVKTGR